MYKDKIILLTSGGMGSFLTGYVLKENTNAHVTYYFNDTYLESEGLYQFLLQTMNYFNPISDTSYQYLTKLSTMIPPIQIMEKRKEFLNKFGNLLQVNYSDFVYDPDGRTVWEVFDDVKFIGNSLFDPCSRILKRERSRQYIESFDPTDIDIAIGIDFTEIHRFRKAKPNWQPHNLIAPLIDFNVDKIELQQEITEKINIKQSKSYELGFSHDNCGRFCVKAGLGHFRLLLETDRSTYLYHENQEQLAFENIGRHPFLKKTVKKKRYTVSLREYRIYLETGNLIIDGEPVILNCKQLDEDDMLEFGGCGCAI